MLTKLTALEEIEKVKEQKLIENSLQRSEELINTTNIRLNQVNSLLTYPDLVQADIISSSYMYFGSKIRPTISQSEVSPW